MALFQAFKLLGYVDKNKIFSQAAVKAARNIKYCATAIVAFIVAAEVYLFIVQRGKDDITGGVAMGLFIIFASLIVVSTADVFEGLLQKAITKQKKDD